MFAGNRTLDLDGSGLGVFLLPYQEDALVYLYDVGESGSRGVWEYVNRPGAPDPKSRASIINTLNALADEGLIGFRDGTGKGGHRRVYTVNPGYPMLDAFTRELVRRLLDKVSAEFSVAITTEWRAP